MNSVFAAMLLNVTYGITIENESNEYLIAAEAWQHGFNQAILPGRFWVDYFPLRSSDSLRNVEVLFLISKIQQ